MDVGQGHLQDLNAFGSRRILPPTLLIFVRPQTNRRRPSPRSRFGGQKAPLSEGWELGLVNHRSRVPSVSKLLDCNFIIATNVDGLRFTGGNQAFGFPSCE